MNTLFQKNLLKKTSKFSSIISTRFSSSVSSVTPFTQIEGRWSKLPKAEQGALGDQLADLQKGDWKNMSLEQKRAGKKNLFISIFNFYFIIY